MMHPNPLLVGLTGQTGAGKSTVSAYLKQRGHRVVDADLVSRQATEKGSACLEELVAAFGDEILLPDGSLDRKALGRIAFSDASKKKLLEAIIFPHITALVNMRVQAFYHDGAPAVFLDAPTLFESGADKRCDYVISVIAPENLRLNRIMTRDGLSREDALLRMRAQHDDAFYASRSQFVIVNDGAVGDIFAQVDDALSQMALPLEVAF